MYNPVYTPPDPIPFRLRTARDVIDLLQEQVATVRADESAGTPEKARTVGFLAGCSAAGDRGGQPPRRLRPAGGVPHTFGRAPAFLVVGARSRTSRLDLAALYF